VNACDICGCGVGSYYIGILPEFSKKIIGLRFRYNTLRTHIGAGGTSSYLTTDETYRTAEVWGGWTIGKKFRMMGYIPVSSNEKFNQGEKLSRTGVGDIGIQGFYQAFNRQKIVGQKLLVHSLWFGAGIKAPFGKYDGSEKQNSEETANIFQLGTGSTDFTFNAMYDLRIMDAGINTTTSYKLNTGNKGRYRYGNKMNINSQVYYKFRVKKRLTLVPNTGILYEKANRDKDKGYEVDVSGGNILLSTVGMELTFKKIALGANWQVPLHQNLAEGFVKAGNRGMVHTSLMF
jgi:hypothetical protein